MIRALSQFLVLKRTKSPITRFENYKALKNKETGFRMDNFHLILLAMNDTGLKNLWRMNSEAHGTGFYYNARV
jgi:DNA polymerase III alpha subunit